MRMSVSALVTPCSATTVRVAGGLPPRPVLPPAGTCPFRVRPGRSYPGAMPHWLRSLLFDLARRGTDPDTSRLIVGSTGSGKSEGEMVDLVRLADRRAAAVVVLDGHGPLAFRTAGHWIARGHGDRVVYEELHRTDRVLCWNMLPHSPAADPARRRLDDAEARDELAQCFLVQRNLATLNDRPLTKEWLEAAITLCLAQPAAEPLTSLPAAFRVGSAEYERLLRDCGSVETAARFRDLERLRRRNEVQYDIQIGAARRLLDLVCGSEVVRLRSRPGPFDWLEALRERRLVVFDGGGIRSREIKRTVFLLASMQVIQGVRRHFAETQTPLPVVLVLEEAGALGLLTPFVLSALQELRKAGLAIHLLTQSCLDFGDRAVFESVLANTPSLAWYRSLSPADQELGATVLANTTFDAHEIHFTRTRQVRDGTERVATESRGEAHDPHGGPARHDSRSGTTFLTRYREETEEYYKSPQLHAQEYRTALATLRVGERFVRDRRGVRRERVRPLRQPRPRAEFAERTRAAIEEIRRQPIYLPPPPDPIVMAVPPVDAAERLRGAQSGNDA